MKLNKIFSSNMVFSVGKNILIYGEGEGNAEISFAGKKRAVTSCGERWLTEFPPMEYGGPYELVFSSEDETVKLTNIYIGAVYLFAGQSNMQFALKSSSTDTSSYVSNSKLRLCDIKWQDSSGRYKWQECEKEKIGDWSAIAYHAGVKISLEKNIAVGIITCTMGASVIESWVPKGTFEKIGIKIPEKEKYLDHTHEEYRVWNRDGFLYSKTLLNVIPFPVMAVVWYQGESDASIEEGKVYLKELTALINTWRSDFGDAELPFIVVQIADYFLRDIEAWKLIQRAQFEIQSVIKNVKTVISADVCENDDIHPKTKDKLSERIAETLQNFSDRYILKTDN